MQTFVVRANVHGWQGPACWAEKGEPLTVKPRGTWKIGRGNVPSIGPSGYEKKLGNFNYGALVMQIGCHTDDLSKKQNARRAPVVIERHAVGGLVSVVPKYGGLVYFYVNDRTPADNAGTIDVAVEGGRLAPVVGYNSPLLKRWPDSLDSAEAPWGELQGDYIALTLPTEEMRKVKDPVKLMKWWDQLYLHYCELDGRQPSQEKTRFVPDVDISVGLMHSGNPIMYTMSKIPELADMDNPKFPRWGFLHELGHNFQRSIYNFEGMSEVTCNLFTLYGFRMMGLETADLAGRRTGGRAKKVAYLAGGAKFEEWQKDSLLGLYMFIELADEFGWDFYKAVFRTYSSVSKDRVPRNNDEKRDLFLTITSRSAGRDLSPFLDEWGIPVSARARAAVSSLPPWNGPEKPKENEAQLKEGVK